MLSQEESPGSALCLRTSYRTLRSGHEQNGKSLEVWLLGKLLRNLQPKQWWHLHYKWRSFVVLHYFMSTVGRFKLFVVKMSIGRVGCSFERTDLRSIHMPT